LFIFVFDLLTETENHAVPLNVHPCHLRGTTMSHFRYLKVTVTQPQQKLGT